MKIKDLICSDPIHINVRIETDDSKRDTYNTNYKCYFEGFFSSIPKELLNKEVISCDTCVFTSSDFKPDYIIGI